MAITTKINVGVPTAVTQTTAYALPSCIVHLTATASVDVSADGTTWTALTASTTGGAYASGAFVRCTTGTTCVITVKKT